jgi:SAM-dependent methyltransferase
VDLTAAGVALTRERLALEGLPAQVHQADAERLPFTDNQFDVVYSYGVLHHTPDTLRSIDELHRVLQPGGRAVVMLYQYPSWSVGWIWLRQGLLRGRLRLTPREAVARYLESPGTKVFTRSEVRLMFHWADELTLRSEVAAGDTFDIDLSGKYRSPVDRVLMCVARLVVAPVVRRSGRRWGLNLLITARKPPRTTA